MGGQNDRDLIHLLGPWAVKMTGTTYLILRWPFTRQMAKAAYLTIQHDRRDPAYHNNKKLVPCQVRTVHKN